MGQHVESSHGDVIRLRIAETRDTEAIVSVINAAFRKAEGFLVDRDRIDLQTVQELLQKGTFLVAEDSFLCGCVYVEPRGAIGPTSVYYQSIRNSRNPVSAPS